MNGDDGKNAGESSMTLSAVPGPVEHGPNSWSDSALTVLNKALVSLYLVAEAYNRGNTFALEECLAPNFVAHDLGTKRLGVGLMKEHIDDLRAFLPDLHVRVLSMDAREDIVVWHWEARGTRRCSQADAGPRHVVVEGTSVARLASGKIVEAWEQPCIRCFERACDTFTSILLAGGRHLDPTAAIGIL